MNFRLKTAAAAILAASLVGSYAFAGDPPAPAKKHTQPKEPDACKPNGGGADSGLAPGTSGGQIDSLKTDLADKDAQLKQAQQAAADAQAAAAKGQAAADAQQQAVTENATAVSTLQSSVNDMKKANASIVSSITDETAAIKKSIASPDALHYKGITISPAGSFLAAETVWRQGATGGDINTPVHRRSAAELRCCAVERVLRFRPSVAPGPQGHRQAARMTLTGYYEMDWLSAGVTSNNNQSNSYTLRQRQIVGGCRAEQAAGTSRGGQGWSLATETTKGLQRRTEILPDTIDPQYTAGFVWTRQYSFRVVKDVQQGASCSAASAENAETLNPAGANLPTNLLIGSAGNGGGLYNPTANYSFNMTPDFVAKIAA